MAAGGPLLLKLHKMSASMHTVQCTAYLAELCRPDAMVALHTPGEGMS